MVKGDTDNDGEISDGELLRNSARWFDLKRCLRKNCSMRGLILA